MEPYVTIAELDSHHGLLSFDVYTAWVRYPKLKIISDFLDNWTSGREQSFLHQLYFLDIKRVGPVNNHYVWKAIFAIQNSTWNSCRTI